jgi:hypothetical protein
MSNGWYELAYEEGKLLQQRVFKSPPEDNRSILRKQPRSAGDPVADRYKRAGAIAQAWGVNLLPVS